MKLAFIHANPSEKFSARLTKLFTGSTAYHCGFVDESDGTFFDMSVMVRKTHWPRYHPPVKWVEMYDAPLLTRECCEKLLKAYSDERYGYIDYILFGLRPIYHFFGQSTRNAGGLICSEMCAQWLTEAGYLPPLKPVPSPADLERWAMTTL